MFHTLTNGNVIHLIGDPHFGRKFLNGVALHRRGEREQMQAWQFNDLMINITNADGIKAKAVVMMGDLFDQFKVDNNTLLTVYDLIAKAAWTHEDVTFFMIQGNHDVTRDTESTSSFDVLERMLIHRPNVVFIKEPTQYTINGDAGRPSDLLLLFPYDAFSTSNELALGEIDLLFGRKVSAAFGHWDVEDFGGNNANLIPAAVLAPYCDYIFTGHVHTPKLWVLKKDGSQYPQISEPHVTVVVVGSMQPYSHGEDPNNNLYVTLPLETITQRLLKDPTEFHHKCVRVLLKKGEEIPTDLDVMQISFKYVDEDEKEENEVKMEIFSFRELFMSCMTENEISEETAESVWSKYQERNRDAQEA